MAGHNQGFVQEHYPKLEKIESEVGAGEGCLLAEVLESDTKSWMYELNRGRSQSTAGDVSYGATVNVHGGTTAAKMKCKISNRRSMLEKC